MRTQKFRRTTLIAAACAALALTAPQMATGQAARSNTGSAAAQGGLVTPKNPQALLAVLQTVDPQARLVTPSDNTPYIQSTYNDLKYLVFFMNCDDAHRNCKSVQFYMGFNDAKDTPLERLNEWNKTKRFGRAYRDDEGDLVIEMDVDMDFNGIPRQNFLEYVTTWKSLMDEYKAHLFP